MYQKSDTASFNEQCQIEFLLNIQFAPENGAKSQTIFVLANDLQQ
jgi:hypothetical protein